MMYETSYHSQSLLSFFRSATFKTSAVSVEDQEENEVRRSVCKSFHLSATGRAEHQSCGQVNLSRNRWTVQLVSSHAVLQMTYKPVNKFSISLVNSRGCQRAHLCTFLYTCVHLCSSFTLHWCSNSVNTTKTGTFTLFHSPILSTDTYLNSNKMISC